MTRVTLLLAIALLLACAPAPAGTILIEDFEAPFPAWESGWLGINSNLQNVYGIGRDRGNNLDGLWIDDGDGIRAGDTSEIFFSPAFAATLTRFEFDVAEHLAGVRLEIFDRLGTVLLSTDVPKNDGAWTDPGVYAHYGVLSDEGIGGFRFAPPVGGYRVEGNTSIDNVFVEQKSGPTVPEPGGCAFLGAVLTGLGLLARRLKAR